MPLARSEDELARSNKPSAYQAKRSRGRKRIDRSEDIPGLSPSPASNLVMADVAMRMGAYLVRRAVQRGFLKSRYGKDNARNIVENRSLVQTLTSVAIARLATSSLPGAAFVTTGMAAKILLDRSRARRLARVEGDRELLEQARDE